MVTFILALSVLLQLTAAALALRLIKLTGRRLAWLFIAAAVALMALRRSVTLYALLTQPSSKPPDLVAESIALAVSIFMVLGIGLIAEVFRSAAAAQRARAVSERHLALLVRTSPDGVLMIDGGGTLCEANPSALRIFETTEDALRAKPLANVDAIPRALRDEMATMLRDLRQGDRAGDVALTFEHELPVRSGDKLVLEGSCRAVDVGEGEIQTEVVLRDVTARRQTEQLRGRLERQAAEARRLDSLGRLAGGIAHDFNNLLTVIIGNLSFLQDEKSLEASARELLDAAQFAAERATALTRQLLTVGRRQSADKQIIELNQTVRATGVLLKRLIGAHIELRFQYAAEEAWVHGDKSQIEQIIINLVTNARDAMPQGGVLEIGTVLALTGEFHVLSVRDNGSGMEASTKEQLFDPFFTTKEVGQGTGLGLATVYGIVHHGGGHILVDSELGAGSEFKVFLPKAPAPEKRQIDQPVAKSPPSGATVLLVEDELAVRRVAARILEAAGFNVIAVDGAKQALAAVEDCKGTIDLLLTDVVMPNTSGPQLAREIHRRLPGLPVLFMSGYPRQELEEFSAEEKVHLIPKPFAPGTLVAQVRELVATRHPAVRR